MSKYKDFRQWEEYLKPCFEQICALGEIPHRRFEVKQIDYFIWVHTPPKEVRNYRMNEIQIQNFLANFLNEACILALNFQNLHNKTYEDGSKPK